MWEGLIHLNIVGSIRMGTLLIYLTSSSKSFALVPTIQATYPIVSSILIMTYLTDDQLNKSVTLLNTGAYLPQNPLNKGCLTIKSKGLFPLSQYLFTQSLILNKCCINLLLNNQIINSIIGAYLPDGRLSVHVLVHYN